MLIVAIPKSASTSLMETIGKLHEIPSYQDFSFKNNVRPSHCKYIHSLHSDVRDLSLSQGDMFNKKTTLYKQHIFPSENNLAILNNQKKVVLLREPNDVVLAYRRGVISKVHNPLPGYSKKLSEKEWIELSDSNGLLADLEFFYNRWRQENRKKKGNSLVVNYEDYIADSKKVINKIESFWELPLTNKEVKPLRVRYSRGTLVDRSLQRLQKNSKNYTVRFLQAIGMKEIIKSIINRK